MARKETRELEEKENSKLTQIEYDLGELTRVADNLFGSVLKTHFEIVGDWDKLDGDGRYLSSIAVKHPKDRLDEIRNTIARIHDIIQNTYFWDKKTFKLVENWEKEYTEAK